MLFTNGTLQEHLAREQSQIRSILADLHVIKS